MTVTFAAGVSVWYLVYWLEKRFIRRLTEMDGGDCPLGKRILVSILIVLSSACKLVSLYHVLTFRKECCY